MAHSENYITPNELFERVAEILRCEKDNPSINKMMHETLVLTCAEGLKDTRHGFGNLSSQVDVLCKMHHVKPSDCVAIQKMRRDSWIPSSIMKVSRKGILRVARSSVMSITQTQ